MKTNFVFKNKPIALKTFILQLDVKISCKPTVSLMLLKWKPSVAIECVPTSNQMTQHCIFQRYVTILFEEFDG